MKVDGESFRTVWLPSDQRAVVSIIDQRLLPFRFEVAELTSVADVVVAIKDMWVRGAGCIGASAAYGMWLAVNQSIKAENFEESLLVLAENLREARPTAVNLSWAVDRMLSTVSKAEGVSEKLIAARQEAERIADEDVAACRSIGCGSYSDKSCLG